MVAFFAVSILPFIDIIVEYSKRSPKKKKTPLNRSYHNDKQKKIKNV